MFVESGGWITSMSMSNEKVYDARNMSAINSESYVTGLVNEFMSSLDYVGSHVEFQAQSAEVDLDPETGTALGLIVTERVSNCLKHAFPDDRAGKISLALKEIDDSTSEPSVADDRFGLLQNVQWDKPNALGLELVRILSNQFLGHLAMKRDRATEIVLRFSRRP
jgi:two-component sensor histidine kinase